MTNRYNYVTGSTVTSDPLRAHNVDFENGFPSTDLKSLDGFVRAVRTRQPGDTDGPSQSFDYCLADGGKKVGGSCWFFGAGSCNSVCASETRVYETATATYAGAAAPDSNGCLAVARAFSTNFTAVSEVTGIGGVGCAWDSGVLFRSVSTPTDAASTTPNGARFCACR